MKNGLMTLAVAGILSVSGYSYGQTDTTKTDKGKSSSQLVGIRKEGWNKKIDVGIGFRNHGVVYVGFTGVNVVEDTTQIPAGTKPSYGIGARVVFGRPHPNTGGLTSVGFCGGYETYFKIDNEKVPVRLLVGGSFYNPENLEANLEARILGIVETSVKVKGHSINVGLELYENKGLNVLVGARF